MDSGDRTDARVRRTVSKVLKAVHQLIEAEGLGSVTFSRVSRETGVSRTTLHRHWSSPSELISDAWSRVAPSNRVAHTDDLEGDLIRLFLAIRDVVESKTMRRSLPTLLVAAQKDRTIARLHAEFVRARREPIVDRLALAVAEGQIAPEANLELVVDLLSGPIFYRHLIRRTRTSDADVAAMVATVLASVRPDDRVD